MSTPQKIIRFLTENQKSYAKSLIDRIPTGGDTVWRMILSAEDGQRNQTQNAKFHAMIADIHEQGFRGYSFDGLKAVLVSQFADEKEQMGEPLRHPGQTVWDWKRQQQVYVRPTTTKFTKKEAGEFIEFLYATGVDLDIRWGEQALSVYDEYREAA